MVGLKKAVLRTLAYGDVFDYPLTDKEVWLYLISPKKVSFKKIKEVLFKIPQVEKKGKFFFLKGRQKTVFLRKKRQKWSRKKLKIANKVAVFLKLIPWVKMVAVTGTLAMANSEREDDIDFLIIAQRNRLWLTRALTAGFLKISGHYRRPGKIQNKICPNMFLDEAHLALPEKERDLYTAHELVQFKPLWDKADYYQKMLNANQWWKQYLANWKN